MRLIVAVAMAAFGLVVAPAPAADAVPGVCPPICDAIPDAAWIAPTEIPLHDVYSWPNPAGLAVTPPAPRFVFEEVCTAPPVPSDPRAFVVAAKAAVIAPAGQWQLQAQVLHWRGPTLETGPLVRSVLGEARTRLRNCQLTAPLVSPSLTTAELERVAAVISVAGTKVVHQYLLGDPDSGSVVELVLWSPLPTQVPWPAVSDDRVFEAMAAPLCEAYLGSCR